MPSAKPLLALIRKTETGKADPLSYDTVIGHKQAHLDKPITQMTVDEVLAAQLYLVRTLDMPSGAAGAYQIIRKTLLGLKKSMSLTGRERFTPALQDRMGQALLDGRGYQKYIAGAITATAFGNQLAREWASFPVLTKQKGQSREVEIGQSYYAGDGINKALVRPAIVAACLREVLTGAHAAPAPKPASVPIPAAEGFTPDWGKISLWVGGAALIGLLATVFLG